MTRRVAQDEVGADSGTPQEGAQLVGAGGWASSDLYPAQEGALVEAEAIAERFWPKVDRRGDDECWPWLGTIRHKREGQDHGTILVDGKNRAASAVAWELHHGMPFPEGLFALHRCDNPPCVNPRHIFPGTQADNQRDSVAKGRHAVAARTHCAHGHPYDEENTRWRVRRGWHERECRTCRREALRAWRAKRKGERA